MANSLTEPSPNVVPFPHGMTRATRWMFALPLWRAGSLWSWSCTRGSPVGPLPSLVALLDELGRSGARIKLVQPENLHTTIAFLGDVPDDATSRLSGALDEAVKGTPPLAMRLRGVGAFPSAKRARVV